MARIELPATATVKLSEPLRIRVAKAMEATGSEVWSEFVRQALTERCRKVELDLQQTAPEEYARIYGVR